MKKVILIMLLLATSLFSLAQDTTKLRSSHQKYRLKDEMNIKDIYGKYSIFLYRVDTVKYLAIQNLENPKDRKLYIAKEVLDAQQNGDSVLLDFASEMVTAPKTEGRIRILLVKDDILMVAILTPWGILGYLIDPKDSKL